MAQMERLRGHPLRPCYAVFGQGAIGKPVIHPIDGLAFSEVRYSRAECGDFTRKFMCWNGIDPFLAILSVSRGIPNELCRRDTRGADPDQQLSLSGSWARNIRFAETQLPRCFD